MTRMTRLPPTPPPERMVNDVSRHFERFGVGVVCILVLFLVILSAFHPIALYGALSVFGVFGGAYMLGWAFLSIKKRFKRRTT